MNPPSTNTNSNVKIPSVFATTCVLPRAAMKRKRESAIWCMPKKAKNCLKNLNIEDICQKKNASFFKLSDSNFH